MKSPKEDYKIHKSVALDSGPREDLLIFSFYTLVIYLHLEAINVLLKYIYLSFLAFGVAIP